MEKMHKHSADPLPPQLAQIAARVQRSAGRMDRLSGQKMVWRAESFNMASAMPGVQIEAEGDICYLGQLSPGCLACRQGAWDCIFLTLACNLACPFCYSPRLQNFRPGSAFGHSPAEIVATYPSGTIHGVSFSGGEPFLEPARLLEWTRFFARELPQAYLWVYTNGWLVTETVLAEIGQIGISEIRFDTAASGYDHPQILQKMAVAARYIQNVTVEIPAIPQDSARVLHSLEPWVQAGVKYLNLHELLYEPDSPGDAFPGLRQNFELPDGHITAFNPLSRTVTGLVMKTVVEQKLPLHVNDCSTTGKLLQVEGRRKSLANLGIGPSRTNQPGRSVGIDRLF
jgi:pyruvate formate-lyase activating enzyme-like uncharacterized protein